MGVRTFIQQFICPHAIQRQIARSVFKGFIVMAWACETCGRVYSVRENSED